MAERKQTPDVLAEVLGGQAPAAESSAQRPVEKPTALPPRQAAAAPPRPRPQPKPQPAPAAAVPRAVWEYEIVSCQEYHGWRPRFVNGAELPRWMSGPEIHDYVNQRSAAGWELVAVASGQNLYAVNDRYQLYFRAERGRE